MNPVSDGGRNALERACGALAMVSLVLMMVTVCGELAVRNLLGYSWDGAEELGSYLLVAVTFLSLATSLAHGGFHEMQLVKDRLPPRARRTLELAIQAACLVASALLTWYFVRLVVQSYALDDRSLTGLRTPLWIPRLAMPLGGLALCLTLALSIWRTWRGAAVERGAPTAARPAEA